MSSEEQPRITGFSRLIVEKVQVLSDNPPLHNYSGIWISKDRHWLIAPTSGRASYQLLPLTQDAGIRMSIEYPKEGKLVGTLEQILQGLSKVMMYAVLREPHEVTHGA